MQQIIPLRISAAKKNEKQLTIVTQKTATMANFSTPRGIRIPVTSVKGRCPRPLDDGGV